MPLLESVPNTIQRWCEGEGDTSLVDVERLESTAFSVTARHNWAGEDAVRTRTGQLRYRILFNADGEAEVGVRTIAVGDVETSTTRRTRAGQRLVGQVSFAPEPRTPGSGLEFFVTLNPSSGSPVTCSVPIVIEDISARWTHLNHSNVFEIDVYGATPEQVAIIHDTLSILPAQHRAVIPRIVVADRVGPIGTGNIRQGGNSDRQGPPETQRIELTHYALDNKLRNVGEMRVCFTLLHEIGHFVDTRMGILPRDAGQRQILEEWFQTLNYQGTTQGAGERSAEAYWRYFIGTLPEEIRRILESSPAFRALVEDPVVVELD